MSMRYPTTSPVALTQVPREAETVLHVTPQTLARLLAQTAEALASLPSPAYQEPDTPSPSAQYSPLKYQRLLRGWSQQDVVNELYQRCAAEGKTSVGICLDLVSKWERGKSKPSPLYRKHLCQMYDLTADRLGLL
jgi:hypothetical protein